jgi:hypothetical protein
VLPAINPEFHFPAATGAAAETLRNNQWLPPHFTDAGWGREIVSDNLILDLLGLALVALCLIGLVPARRPPGRCVGDF